MIVICGDILKQKSTKETFIKQILIELVNNYILKMAGLAFFKTTSNVFVKMLTLMGCNFLHLIMKTIKLLSLFVN